MFGRQKNRGASPGPAPAASAPGATPRLARIDVPVYLDTGVALSLAASLSRGVSMESSVQVQIASELTGAVKGRIGQTGIASLEGQAGGSRTSAVTENEVRQQTNESVFNGVRSALDSNDILFRIDSSWADVKWAVGDFVEFTPGRMIVPLVSVLERLRVIAESFAFATKELSSESLRTRIPQALEWMRSETEEDEGSSLDDILGFVTETGEIATAVGGVVARLEAEAEASGLVDVIMFESQFSEPAIAAVASLDRTYVDTKLLRRLAQGEFTVLGKVLRAPVHGTALNAFRNSMLGSTNQLPVLLTQLTERLYLLPKIFGDGVTVGDEESGTFLNFVGSASAITELRPLLLLPSLEVLPVAIYA